MSSCVLQEAGTIELYFYDELDQAARAEVRAHLAVCRECTRALEELQVIRAALASRPDVAAPASGEWHSFMARLDAAVKGAVPNRAVDAAPVLPFVRQAPVTTRPWVGLVAMAALLAVVAMSVFLTSRAGRDALAEPGGALPAGVAEKPGAAAADGPDPVMRAALTSVGASHLERSKLVVLGLATKEPGAGDPADWAYERELASALLNDTRLYRQAAEQRGLTSLAGVMRDLEIVLLQASMAEASDRAALPQIQRLIQKRGLVDKMDVAGATGTTGILP